MSATGRTGAADLLVRIHLLHARQQLSDAPAAGGGARAA